jgi:hypothetical protein
MQFYYEMWPWKSKNYEINIISFPKDFRTQNSFHNSELFFSMRQEDVTLYADMFGYGQGQFAISNLGIPILAPH